MLCILGLLISQSAFGGIGEAGRIEREGTVFYTYVTEPANVDLFWRSADGVRYGQFSTLQKALAAEGRDLEFIANAGIFEEGGIPSGLLIIGSKVLCSLNTADGRGNFYLKPNGVFYMDEPGAFVISTDEYVRRKPQPRLAIQSGPLLLRNGKVHPAFSPTSSNLLHRNGVGIRKDGKVVFAITEFGQSRYCNLYSFAELFRSLGCQDALFLDGDLSQMLHRPGTITPGNFFGAIFAVAPKVESLKSEPLR